MNPQNYQAADYFQLDELFSEEHKIVRTSIRDWVNRAVKPIIEDYAERAIFPIHLIKELGSLGAFGPYLPEKYGCAGLDYTAYGIIMQELERGDSGIRSAASVQSSLVMYPIYTFGSEAQRLKYLPGLATGELIGCFGLTEPNHGSNPGGMESRLHDAGDHYVLNGAKMWITNAPVADVAVVWAKDESGIVRGVIVEKGMKGFSAPETHGKWSLRASSTGELVFDEVMIPKENILPHIKGLKGPMMCLNSARYGIAWGAVGAAMDCYDAALRYSLERKQFGKPIASFQLQQKKLAEALTEITKAQLLVWRLGVLQDQDKASPAQISMAKRNNVAMALNVARETRQILGAMGITNDFPMMRHMMNLESVITYEGTHDVHLLITGHEITGIGAFT
ncbi:MAG: acyl-CoA dehydrogenase family protein [Bacteroidetes bacterium]|nr:acyl-CoA dehydrogenase family protein [Bacteroidota bacterium]MBU1577933.1 acyl-CoA dehydrogenase family protein [Bacteroidota bacterium]MBU2556582.1 acyl-CoA dehydrogenase family protein [Bacteroidota bacterium]